MLTNKRVGRVKKEKSHHFFFAICQTCALTNPLKLKKCTLRVVFGEKKNKKNKNTLLNIA
jgi:hypothetical protein